MYNCAPVVVHCLNSIDVPGIEILVIDDGSKDNGADVVSDYIQDHPNVRLIKKPNGGVSSARNLGIEHANGEFIAFVDADDYLLKGRLVEIVQIAKSEDADVVKYLIKGIKKGEEIPDFSSDFSVRKLYGRAEALQHYDISDYHVVDALFKKSVLIDNNIRFKEDLHLHEDDTFMCEVYCNSTKVISTDLTLYIYNVASDFSSTHRTNYERTMLLVDSAIKAISYRKEAIRSFCPDISFPYERYKHMRYAVGAIWTMLLAQTPWKEYRQRIAVFNKMGILPLSFKWIKVARFNYSYKLIIKTLACNMSRLSFFLLKLYLGWRK